MWGRRCGRAALARAQIDFALGCGRAITIMSPARGGGVHYCTVYPFRQGGAKLTCNRSC